MPSAVCSPCRTGLKRWIKKEGHLNFGQPMLWRDPIEHATNCYICLTQIFSFSRRTGSGVHYAEGIDSITKPINHSDGLPVPKPPENNDVSSDDTMDQGPGFHDDDDDDDMDPLYLPDTKEPHKLSQGDFDDLSRDLNLSKKMSELLASRLQQWCLLQEGYFRNRSTNSRKFFTH